VRLVAKPRRPFRVVNVRVPIPASSIVVDGDIEYADIDLGEESVRVVNPLRAGAPVPIRTLDGRKVVGIPLSAGGDLASSVLVKTYRQERVAGSFGEVRLEAVSSFDLRDMDSGAQVSVSLQVPGPQSCVAAGIGLTANEVPDWSPSPPLQLIDCPANDCANAYAGWMRAYHDVGVVLEMLELIAYQSESERPTYWDSPWVDAQGAEVLETSLEHWFGEYSSDRFDAIWSAYEKAFKLMQTPGAWTLPADTWTLTCRDSNYGNCVSTSNRYAYHQFRGKINLCGDDFTGLTNRFGKSRILVHEALHFMWIPYKAGWVEIRDEHVHRGGPSCNRRGKFLGYDRCGVLHLADFPDDGQCWRHDGDSGCGACSGSGGGACNHRELALQNNDTYGFASASIGKALRVGESQKWPSPSAVPGTLGAACPVPSITALDPVATCVYVDSSPGSYLDCTAASEGVTCD
jgi:hypothetical protein